MSIFTVALAAGAGSAVFAVAGATIARRLPFPAAERLVKIFSLPPQAKSFDDRNPLGSFAYVELRKRTGTLEAIEGIWAQERALGGDGEPMMVPASSVSPGMFQLFGGSPILGRTFTEDEDRISAQVVVLSYGLWSRKFANDTGVIGRTIPIDRQPYRIIGVMPKDFQPAFIASEMWLPLGIYEGNMPLPNATYIQSFGRTRPGVRETEASDETTRIIEALAKERPTSMNGWSGFAMNLRQAQYNDQRQAVQVLVIAGIVLAVIACANLANLTLTEVLRKRSEAALRTILGATGADLVFTSVLESAFVAGFGTLLGLLISRAAVIGLLSLNAAQKALTDSVRFDSRVVVFTLVLAFLTSIAAHLWPVLRFFGRELALELAEGGHRTAGSRRGRRARYALLVTQTALSVVLIVCGGLLLSAFVRLSTVRPGYDAANVLMLRLRFVESAYPTVPARTAFIENVIERIQQIPGVVAAGTVNSPLTVGDHFVTLIRLEDKPTPDGQPRTVEFRRVSPGYFKALQIRQQSGRTFSDSDGNEAPQVSVINKTFADRFWTGENVLGKRIQRNGGTNAWSTVVGVVDDVRDYDLNAPSQPTIYIPFAQNNAANAPAAIAIRTTGDPLSFAAAVRQAIHTVDPLQAVDRIVPLDRFMAESIGPQAFRSALVLAFAVLGLLLTSIGIYGITARSVQERTDEFGIRVALGATRREIWRIAVLQSLNPVGIGMLAGVALSAGAIAFMTRVLPGTTLTNSVITIPLVVVPVVAFLAAGWPAYSATHLNPLQAIQSKN